MNFEEYDKKAGRIVKLLRINKKITQRDVAKVIQVDPSKLSHIEAGDQALTLGQFLAVTDKLNMNASDVLKLIIAPDNENIPPPLV